MFKSFAVYLFFAESFMLDFRVKGRIYVRSCDKMDVGSALDPDIISNLPLNVLEHILMCLPIRDAVRTGILSSKWRYKWVSIPELVFDDSCVPISSSITARKSKFVTFVDRVLLLHKGPI